MAERAGNEMTETTPDPDLIEAVTWLRANAEVGKFETPRHARAILAALPEEVTNPKPELPTADGRYADREKDDRWTIVKGVWLYDGRPPRGELDPANFAPFVRVVPEKPPVTAKDILDAFNDDANPDPWQAVADYVNGDRS
jgi:hypothetical protein